MMDDNNPNTLNLNMDQFRNIFNQRIELNIEPAFLLVRTDAECAVFIDHVKYGNTQLRVPITGGEHLVQLVHTAESGAAIVYGKTMDLTAGNLHTIDYKIFTTLSVTAGKMCRVLLNGKEAGFTPLKQYLYSGRTYQLTVEYAPEGTAPVVVWDETIETAGMPLERHFPANGSLVLECNPAFKAILAEEALPVSPCTIDSLLPGNYQLKIVLDNPAGNGQWIFYDKPLQISSYNTLNLELSDFDYKKNQWMSYIPFMIQFHNRESGKGFLLTGLFTGALAGLCWSTLNMAYYTRKISKIDAWFTPENSPVNAQALIDDRNEQAALLNANTYFALGSGIIAAVLAIYSIIDGFIISNDINRQLYPGDALNS